MNKVIHDSPVGPLTFISDDDVLIACSFTGSSQPKDVADIEVGRPRDLAEVASHGAYLNPPRPRLN